MGKNNSKLLAEAAEARQKAEHDKLVKELEQKHDKALIKQQEKFNSIIRDMNQERLSKV